MTTPAGLEYLAKRLAYIGGKECTLAFTRVTATLADFSQIENNSDAEHDLFHIVWNHVSRALDHGEFAEQHRAQLQSIESEMAGDVLTLRVQKGLLISPPPPEKDAPRGTPFETLLGRVNGGPVERSAARTKLRHKQEPDHGKTCTNAADHVLPPHRAHRRPAHADAMSHGAFRAGGPVAPASRRHTA